jgi:photosystem II stability/assembly factor-like uncharacterized protein
MTKQGLFAVAVVVALLFTHSCSKAKAPGAWLTLDPGVGDGFTIANFIDENIGWINGYTDRGSEPAEGNENANANKKITPKTSDKKPEDPLKANQGFEVLQTTDGGQTWSQLRDQFKHKIRSVWFVDQQQGWALTIERDILHTSDGGATWALQRKAGTIKLKLFGNRRQPVMDQPEQIERVYFIDDLHGWAWGGGRKDQYTEQPGTFLATIDGGQNWNSVPYPFTQDVWSLYFLNANVGWVSERDGGFYKTTDGGLNWTAQQGKMPELTLNSIFFLDENYGWVAGRSGRLAKTTDGGRTWKKANEVRNEFKMRDVVFTDPDHGWAVGDNGAILHTPDGGATWLDYSVPGVADLRDLVFLGKKTGWAVGLSGAVLRYDVPSGSSS